MKANTGTTTSGTGSVSAPEPPDPHSAPAPRLLYYYHPDYLGNVEYITDADGLPYQYFWYNPWGETLKEDKNPNAVWDSPYKFNGKELDEETGLYYYGARYYNPQISVWLSVDAMAGNPHNLPLTPYHFSANNPVMIIDPDGNDWVYSLESGEYEWNDNAIDVESTPEGYRYVGTDEDVITDMGYSTETKSFESNMFGMFGVSDENSGGVQSVSFDNGNFKSKVNVSLSLSTKTDESAISATNSQGKTIGGIKVTISGYVRSSLDEDGRYTVTGATHSLVGAGDFSDNFVYTKRPNPKPQYSGQTFMFDPMSLGTGSTVIPMNNLKQSPQINVRVFGWWFVNGKQVGMPGAFGLIAPALFTDKISF